MGISYQQFFGNLATSERDMSSAHMLKASDLVGSESKPTSRAIKIAGLSKLPVNVAAFIM